MNITDYGLGTTTIIVQDPTFTKLAHQALTSGNEYYNLIDILLFKRLCNLHDPGHGGALRLLRQRRRHRRPGDPERRDRVPDFEQPGGRHGQRHLQGHAQPLLPGGKVGGAASLVIRHGAGGAPPGADQRQRPLEPVHGALYGGLEDLRRRASRGNQCGHRRRARRRQRCGLPQAGQLAHVLRGRPVRQYPCRYRPLQ